MKLLKSWLQDYIDINISDEELADDIVSLGTEVDKVEKSFDGDVIFDLEITPNRGDLLSHLGMARDLAPVLKQDVCRRKTDGIPVVKETSKLKINIEDEENCSLYYGIILSEIKIAESPNWLKDRLVKCGMRPINNIVDVTNYVMFDLGQPLHAFDASKITDKEIIVRQARSGERITTLDGQTKDLETGMLLIADKEKPLAIAGVMGGGESEVSDSTTEIVLEAAQFNPKSVRGTAKKLNLSSEASYRFERGVDPEGVCRALEKAANMIIELTGGKIATKIVFAGHKPEETSLEIDYEKINKLLGTDFSLSEIDSILKSLGFNINNQVCRVPSWRHDIDLVEDLAEEVARVSGYKNIPQHPIDTAGRAERGWYYKKEFIKDILAENGFSEVINYPFLSEGDLAIVAIDPSDLLVAANPVNIENKYLRRSLLPGLLKSVAKNPSFDPVLVFEVGRVFSTEREETNLAVAASGKNAEKSINKALEAIDLVAGVGTAEFNLRSLSREDLTRYKIRKPVTYIAEIALGQLVEKLNVSHNDLALTISSQPHLYRSISRFPSIVRDVAFVTDQKVDNNEVKEAILKSSELINRVELFDEFVSDKLGAGKKNIAFHLDLQHQERTLTDQEAEAVMASVVKTIESEFGAKWR